VEADFRQPRRMRAMAGNVGAENHIRLNVAATVRRAVQFDRLVRFKMMKRLTRIGVIFLGLSVPPGQIRETRKETESPRRRMS
jgi:hypothetical protein